MTRKHFETLAAALKKCRPDRADFACADCFSAAKYQWVRAVKEVSDMCADANANFRRSTFLDACGFDD
jgi:hypothetical protein